MSRRKTRQNKSLNQNLAGGSEVVSSVSQHSSFLHKMCDSVPIKILGVVSAVISITVVVSNSINKHQPRDKSASVESRMLALTPPPSTSSRALPSDSIRPHSGRSTTQISHGPQSQNVSGVRGKVNIQYASPTAGRAERATEGTPAPVVPEPPTSGEVVTQISHGAQSQNVSDIRGNVDIQFGSSPTAGSAEKLTEKKK